MIDYKSRSIETSNTIEITISIIPITHNVLYFLEDTPVILCLSKFHTLPKMKLRAPDVSSKNSGIFILKLVEIKISD